MAVGCKSSSVSALTLARRTWCSAGRYPYRNANGTLVRRAERSRAAVNVPPAIASRGERTNPSVLSRLTTVFLCRRYIRPQKSAIAGFIQVPGRQSQDRLCSVFLAGGEKIAIEFEKQDTHHKAGALIAIHERTAAHDASRIGGGHVYDIGRLGIGEMLLRQGQRGLE